MNKAKIPGFTSVWDAIADTPEEAANLRVRAELMEKIAALISHRAAGRRLTRPGTAA